MFIVREAAPDDVDSVLALAQHLDSVNLPADRAEISSIIDLSLASFAQTSPPDKREYLLVLEDLSQDPVRIIGTSMIHAQHGTRRAPHIYFDVGREECYSLTLDRYFVHQTLRLGYDYNGPTEIGGLILHPDYRGHTLKLGKLLSFSRFLLMAKKREWFRDKILSELLPPLKDDGTSRLWEHLGRRFTGLSYQEADKISRDNKEFISALFPHGLIFTALFPQDVQDVIGEVGPHTVGVRKMLMRLGFEYAQQIDPFDGGPHFVAETEQVLTHAHREKITAIHGNDVAGDWAVVASTRDPYEATVTAAARMNEGVGLSKAVVDSLRLKQGDDVWLFLPK